MVFSCKTLYQKENVHRTHDKFYLNENRKDDPKEYFKFIAKIARPLLLDGEPEVIDVGCATGDFVYYLKRNYPNVHLVGMDIDDELLERARTEVEGVTFIQGDITRTVQEGFYDIIFLNGVHSIFDNLVWLENLLKLMASERSRVFVFGLFNPEDLDVFIKSRAAVTNGKWETGWNLYSKKTVLSFLENKGFSAIFHDFELGLDLEKRPDDPLRSWTEKLENGRRIIVNGLQLINTLSLLEVKKNSGKKEAVQDA